MMKAINVIDLDKTLIPYDSFRKFVMIQIKKMNSGITLITVTRLLRLISQKEFKRKVIDWSTQNCTVQFLNNFSDEIYENIDKRVLEIVDKETDSDTINVLVSASPDLYVQLVIERLKWKGKGSFIQANGEISHLYEENKVLWVQQNYPKDKFNYNMSISDSSSDDALLKLFKKEIKWILP